MTPEWNTPAWGAAGVERHCRRVLLDDAAFGPVCAGATLQRPLQAISARCDQALFAEAIAAATVVAIGVVGRPMSELS